MFLVMTVTPALFLSDLFSFAEASEELALLGATLGATLGVDPDCESGLSTAVLRGVIVGIVSVRVLTAMKGVGSGSLVVASFWARSTSSLSLACIAARC